MFHRRKHSNPLQNAPPNLSASLAASQAFGNKQKPNASLSSSAAAAALRARTPPPTNPADIQTKRMVRRGSNSSNGSAAGRSRSPMSPPPLQRTNSNSSMTERTFRSPSPGRRDVSTPVRADPSAPPVPALPQTMPAGRGGSHLRAASLEAPPQRLSSPPGRGRGSSVDPQQRTPHPRVASLSQLPEINTGGGARSSVNFSRPMSPSQSPVQNNSPPQARAGRSGWFTGPVGGGAQMRQDINDRVKPVTMPSGLETRHIQQSLQTTAEAPVAKKKKRSLFASEGSRLAKSNNEWKPTMVFDKNTRRMVPASVAPALAPAPAPLPVSIPRPIQQSQAPPIPERAPAHKMPEPVPEVSSTLAAKVQKGTSPTVAKSHPLPVKATTQLAKKPSVVREESEEDESEAETEPMKQNLQAASVALAQPTPTRSARENNRVSSLEPGTNVASVGRSASLSPSRSAHFSNAVTFLNGARHDPPPRSLSPAKPALKPSPASSVRTGSPVTNFRTTQRDVSVSGSEEGSVTRQKKKSARVSFGDEPVEIIPDTSPSSSGLMSSRYATKETFDDEDEFEMSPRPVLPSFVSNRGRSRDMPQPVDPVVKVTETVPSSMSTSVSTIPPESMQASSDHAVGGLLADELEKRKAVEQASSAERRFDPNEPLPPEVTSVEGPGYFSDSSEDEQAQPIPDEPALKPMQPSQDVSQELSLPAPKESMAEAPITNTTLTVDVPSIAVQPATPAATEATQGDEWAFVMPGGFAGSWEDEEIPSKQELPKVPSSKPEVSTTSQPLSAAALESATQQQALKTVAEDSSDGDSIYSDAEEDLSDHEPYASLNAIVESPIESPSTRAPFEPDSSPLKTVANAPPTTIDWNETKAHWSGLTKLQRQELEKQARPEAPAQPLPAQPAPPKKKKKKAAAVTTQQGPTPAAPKQRTRPISSDQPREEHHFRTSMRNRGPQQEEQRQETHFRQSMRNRAPQQEEQPETHLRKSMRTGGTMPTSMRGAQGAGLQASRYSNVPSYEPRAALQKKNIPLSSAPAAAASRPATAPAQPPKSSTMPLLLRSDSDSDSSFKRARRPTSVMSDGERYSMRRSMRGAPEPERSQEPARRPMIRTMRSESPPASPPVARPASSGGVEAGKGKGKRFSFRSLSPASGSLMRNPLRSSLDDGREARPSTAQPAPRATLRGSTSPPRMPAFNKEPKGKAPMKPAKPALKTGGFKSRFADDSDDDSPVMQRTFRSRFADSDDEDSPVAVQELTPVRGIPRKPGHEDGDSTDLEDESGDEVGALQSPKGSKMTNGNTATKPEGGALAAGSMRGLASSKHATTAEEVPGSPATSEPLGKPKKEKRSFFGMGRRKRSGSVPTQGAITATTEITTTQIPSKASKILGSPDRPKSPKLQRRNTPQPPLSPVRVNTNDSWPLPLPPPPKFGDGADERPSSAGGPDTGAAKERPDMANRRSTVDGTVTLGSTPALSGTAPGLRFAENDSVLGEGAGGGGSVAKKKKKKKFGALRRAFKLDD